MFVTCKIARFMQTVFSSPIAEIYVELDAILPERKIAVSKSLTTVII